ncbi:MAG: Na+-translocating decarboxylase subunit beta [Alphaproteobacteria bacterium]|nr:Na+-translocating decarboxylase subunit beta [Alphaproteobacteria bacterium]
MQDIAFIDLFQGVATLVAAEPHIMIGRLFLIGLGFALIWLGHKGVLEAMLMVPMGLGMATVNAAVLFMEDGSPGTLFLDPLASGTDAVVTALQIDWLQPVYTLMFSNGLIACLVFIGIGTLLDVGYVMQRPFTSMFLAICGELGTVIALPLATMWGLPLNEAAAAATIGGADGPMVLFASLILAPEIFVAITVVGYLYLGLTYGGYPHLVKALVPERLRAIQMPVEKLRPISSAEKMVFAIIACVLLSLLFPVAAPLFLSLFLGVVIRESGLSHFRDLFSEQVLYGATLFLGLVLGVLCEAGTILDPKVLILLGLGIIALVFSALGGLLGGYAMWWFTGGRFNPVIGIAAVSCLPTTAKVAQKIVTAANPNAIVLPHALGVSISGVITSATFAAILISMLRVG